MTTITGKKVKLVPPDGGWGWMVLLGTGVTNIFNQSMVSMFSLLYGDVLEEMGHDTSGAAFVLSIMLFVTNFGGPIAGAIVKLTGPRFVAVFGACCSTIGIFFSGFSTKLWHLTITYGIILGLGLGFIQNASYVAINKYFKEKKSVAYGISLAGSGLGQTLMPHVATYFLENYGFKGACTLLASLSLHGVCGTMLMQPVEWHMKKIEEDIEADETLTLLQDIPSNSVKYTLDDSKRQTSEPCFSSQEPADVTKSMKISQSHKDIQVTMSPQEKDKLCLDPKVEVKSDKKFLQKMYELFDVSLLSSPRFLNIIIGTALTIGSIQNFSLIFPPFLQKVALLDKKQTAYCMSAVASVDIVGRICLPIVQDKFKIAARTVLVLTSIWIIVVRQILANQTDLYVILALSGLYGLGRSMLIVPRNIAISEQCRTDQVPSAVGMGMLSMGFIVPPMGFLLGWIRDYTGSYLICITAQNCVLVIFLIMWIPDMLYLYIKEKRKKKMVQVLS